MDYKKLYQEHLEKESNIREGEKLPEEIIKKGCVKDRIPVRIDKNTVVYKKKKK